MGWEVTPISHLLGSWASPSSAPPSLAALLVLPAWRPAALSVPSFAGSGGNREDLCVPEAHVGLTLLCAPTQIRA